MARGVLSPAAVGCPGTSDRDTPLRPGRLRAELRRRTRSPLPGGCRSHRSLGPRRRIL